ERQPAAEVGPLLGLAPNAVAALAYRAREGLRQAYLQAHLQLPPPDACRETITKLGAYVRDGLSARDRRKVDEHLKQCERCTAVPAAPTTAARRATPISAAATAPPRSTVPATSPSTSPSTSTSTSTSTPTTTVAPAPPAPPTTAPPPLPPPPVLVPLSVAVTPI